MAVAPPAARSAASWSSITWPRYCKILTPQGISLAAKTPRPAMREVFTSNGYVPLSLRVPRRKRPRWFWLGDDRGHRFPWPGTRVSKRHAQGCALAWLAPSAFLACDLVPFLAQILLQLLDFVRGFLLHVHELGAGAGIVTITEIKAGEEGTATGIDLRCNVAHPRRAGVGAGSHSGDCRTLIHTTAAALWDVFEVDCNVFAALVEQGHGKGSRHKRQLYLIRALCQARHRKTKRCKG